MKKKMQILVVVVTAVACSINAAISTSMVYGAPPKRATGNSTQQFELTKLEFMLDAKAFAEKEYTEIIKQELLGQIVNKQMNEAKCFNMMASNMEERAAANEENAQAEIAAEAQADKSLDELMLALGELQENTERLAEPIETGALVAGTRSDAGYAGQIVTVTGDNRDKLERLVMGEAGGEGFVGAALVAQTIRDTMVADGMTDVMTIKQAHGYSAGLDMIPTEDVKRAVAYVFDEGGVAIQHRLEYYYAPARSISPFHEKQKFVIEYGGHRFFEGWGE